MEMDTVTAAEADAYRQWRDGYQRYLSQFFDPIALRLTAKPDRLAADLTVMPLIASSQYNAGWSWGGLFGWGAGARLTKTSGDPHPEAIAQLVIGVGDEARQWEEGRCLVFEDYFEHEAWNHTDEDRIVLIVDLWHPDLSATEIRLLEALHRYAYDHAGRLNRYWSANAAAQPATS